MKRLLILLALAPVWAAASPITTTKLKNVPIITGQVTPVITATCTINGVSSNSPCDPYDVLFAVSMDNGSLRFDSGVQTWIGGPAGTTASESLSLSLDLMATTDGPVRDGFITYVTVNFANGDGPSEGATGESASVSIAGLDTCTYLSECQIGGVMVPFKLGVPFEINLNVAISTDTSTCKESGRCAYWPDGFVMAGGDVYAGMELQLFEAHGASFDVPEPSGWTLFAIGLAAIFVFRARATLTGLRTPSAWMPSPPRSTSLIASQTHSANERVRCK